MGCFDWVELGAFSEGTKGNEGFAHSLEEAYKGSFGVTIGDALSSTFGGVNTHIFGERVTFICDVLDLLGMGALSEALPMLSALLNGAGGNSQFVMGPNTSAVYNGPYMTVLRGEKVERKSEALFPSPIVAAYHAIMRRRGGRVPASPEQDAIAKAIAVLLVLTAVAAAICELLIHFLYPKFGKTPTNEEEQEEIEDYGYMPSLLKMLDIVLTSRLLGIVNVLEDAGSWAGMLEKNILLSGSISTWWTTLQINREMNRAMAELERETEALIRQIEAMIARMEQEAEEAAGPVRRARPEVV